MSLWSFITSLFKKKPAVVALPPSGDTMVSKALLVGINKYPGAPLSGCVNDVTNMANLLIQNYGYKANEIRIIKDKDATTANILAALNWLVDVKSGDRILFHYSGHGAQSGIGGKDEPDGLSEVICPVDFDWTEGHMIIDNQLVSIFSRIPAGCVFNWVSDSCHSGDLTREMMFVPTTKLGKLWHKLSFWKETKKNASKTMPIPIHQALRINKAKSKGLKIVRSITNGALDVGFISGCTSTQTSADTEMNGQPCGALTYFLIKAIKAMPNESITKIVAAVNADLIKTGYTQRPQAEGTRVDKPFQR